MREVVIVAVSSTLGNLLIGWDSSTLAGGMSYMKQEFNLESDPRIEGLIVSMTFLAGTCVTTFSGSVSDLYGRRPMLIISSITFILSGVVALWAPNVYVVVLSRVLSGVAIALAVTVTPLYISEISPPEIRGQLNTVTQFSCSAGMFLAYCLVFSMSLMASPSWRLMLGIISVPSVAYFLITLFYLPESPRWLVTKGRLLEAKKVLQRIRGTQDVSGELALLVEGLSPGGESTCLEEYIVAPATEMSAIQEAGRDCIKLYGPNDEEVSMVAQPVTADGSMMIMSPQGSMGMGISQSQTSFKDPLVTLFGIMHDNLFDTTGSGIFNIPKVINISSNMGDETNHNTAGTNHNLHTPLLLSRQASATADRPKGHNEAPRNTNIGGGWQLVYKAAVGGGGHNESGLQRVYLHAEAGGSGFISQRAASFNVSSSGLDVSVEGEAAFPASALVSHSVLGTNKDMEKIISEATVEQVAAQAQGWRALIEPGVRRALIVGIGLQILQQAAGINGFLYYGPQILEQAGIGAFLSNLGISTISASLLANVIITLCMLPCIALSMKLMDVAGRRSIMLYTVPILIVCLMLLVVRDYMNMSSTLNAAVTTLSVVVYESVFCMGFGVIPNIMCAEIFPTSVRGICISICCLAFWISTLIVTSIFPSLLQLLGLTGVFGLFVVGCIVSWLFAYLKVPETKGMPLEVITEFFAIGAKPGTDLATITGISS